MGDRLDLAPFTYLEKLEGVGEGVREIKPRKCSHSDILHQKHAKGKRERNV